MKIASTAMTPIGRCLGALGRLVADAALDREVHVDPDVVRVDRHEDEVRVDDLDVGVLDDVARDDRPGARLLEAQLDGVAWRSS